MKSIVAYAVATLVAFANALPTTNVNEMPEVVARSSLESRATNCSVAATDTLLFSVPIGAFLEARKARDPSQCSWASDGCTMAPDKPISFNFIPSCQRHDFGYRNCRDQKRFTSAMRKKIDDVFKKDLYKYCSQFSGWHFWKGYQCRRLADTYYAAVRTFGKRDGGYVDLDQPVELVERGPRFD
ncbi:hypothetical protein DCS_05650 [Drechmeria coniospora]|uniref:Secretory phospholipase A2 n=1 Tax=Drechmeria coniospora TaxID=98403 RepID=A0A151GNE9_DRECN|nr:hypothetical protein DCS_05650 [Drechmeria coniospora]KYK58633.1 hypothetical protein DCS_05650 [Drechmeria coniospora]ODA83997.1 hypothetical protein RJ55_02515 [Drechmeria coniospora]